MSNEEIKQHATTIKEVGISISELSVKLRKSQEAFASAGINAGLVLKMGAMDGSMRAIAQDMKHHANKLEASI